MHPIDTVPRTTADPKAPVTTGRTARIHRAAHSLHGAAQPATPSLAIGADLWLLDVAAADTGDALSVMRWHGRTPGGPPLHLHPDQDEVFIVEEGRYRFQCGDERFELAAGDSIFLPRQVPHTFCQLSPVGRLRFLYTPAGRMEDFFVALARLPMPPAPERAMAVFADHGMQVVGPPLAID